MTYDADIIVIGAGGGGPVIAKELGEMGLKVLILEAGPWYGNSRWPNPNQERGGKLSFDTADLDLMLYKRLRNKLEYNMDDAVSGRFRWGPADRRRTPWNRSLPQNGSVWQTAGVGGSTLHYTGNSPRAFPSAIDQIWPITYRELIPYYEKVEQTLPVTFAPTTSKEALFYYGAKRSGWSLNATLDVTLPGYRPQPNAILRPNENLTNPRYSLEELSFMEGCTLSGHCNHGCPHGPSVEKIAMRSTDVSYVPLALKTGNVTIRPNVFATKILTETDIKEGDRVTGVQIRDTWTGEIEELSAKTVVMAAGAIETPRLWLNSGLPTNPWVGKGLTNHYQDWVSGIFDEKDLLSILGSSDINPFVGQVSAVRLDVPGLGSMELNGKSPGMLASTLGTSQAGSSYLNKPQPGDPWNIRGRVVGSELKKIMANYSKMMNILLLTDDEVVQGNGVTLDPSKKDEHGYVPVIKYSPTPASIYRRDQLAVIAADILRQAGAKTIIRTDSPSGVFGHIHCTMRMGFVVDSSCEAFQVKRLYIADNSVLFNSLGSPNPTLTTQALATRTAEKLANKYFS